MTDAQPVCTIPDCSHDDNLRCPVLRAELDALGCKPASPDHWVYRQGTAFIFDEIAWVEAQP
jgi:hypothetical protein